MNCLIAIVLDYIIRHLFLDRYVEGVALINVTNKVTDGVKILPGFGITPKGITYIFENSILQRIKGSVKEISPFVPKF